MSTNKLMIYNSIEEELWRIFSFYTLHADPISPNLMKLANFIRFCKDCQIISKKVTTYLIEIEVTKQVIILYY